MFHKFDLELGNAGLGMTRSLSNRRRLRLSLISQELFPRENGLGMLYYYVHQTEMIIKFNCRCILHRNNNEQYMYSAALEVHIIKL